MKNNNLSHFKVIVFFLVSVMACKKEEASHGREDPRLLGTWRIDTRLHTVDSSYYETIAAASGDTTVLKDTTFIRKKAIAMVPAQTITFADNGLFSSAGKETEYYRAYRYYRVEEVEGHEKIGFVIGGDFASPAYQDFTLRNDSLYLFPSCEKECYLLFRRQ